MASKNKTEIGLNLWEGEDKPKREDFNADNRILTSLLLDGDGIWRTLPVNSGMSGTVRYSKKLGFVFVQGSVVHNGLSGANNVICTLPSDYRTDFALSAAQYYNSILLLTADGNIYAESVGESSVLYVNFIYRAIEK